MVRGARRATDTSSGGGSATFRCTPTRTRNVERSGSGSSSRATSIRFRSSFLTTRGARSLPARVSPPADEDEARRIAVRAQLLDAERPADLLGVVQPPHLPAARPDGRGRAERRPCRLDAPGRRLPARTTSGAPDATGCSRATRLGPPDGGPRPLPGRMSNWPFPDEEKRLWPPPGISAHRWFGRTPPFGGTPELLRGPARSSPATCRIERGPVAVDRMDGNRNVTQMLELLAARGEIAIAGRARPAAALGPRRTGLSDRTS